MPIFIIAHVVLQIIQIRTKRSRFIRNSFVNLLILLVSRQKSYFLGARGSEKVWISSRWRVEAGFPPFCNEASIEIMIIAQIIIN